MLKRARMLLIAGGILAGSAAAVLADDEAERLIEEALPQMYHTCASLVTLADGDEAVVLDVLEKIASVSVYMREIDIASFQLTDAQLEEVEAKFYMTIGEGCAEDPNALLAGIVDDAVKAALGL